MSLKLKKQKYQRDVLNAFKTKYLSAQVIKWKAEKEDSKFYFEAEWKEKTVGREKWGIADI